MKSLIKTCLYLFNFALISAAQASSLETSTYKDIAYFADDQSTVLKRYSLADEKFLAPITLEQTPTAVHVDSSGIYISYAARTVKLNLAGTNATQISTTSYVVYDIEATDQYLLLSGYNFIQIRNKTTNTLVSTNELWYSSPNISLSPDHSQIYSTSELSPAHIRQITFNNGSLGSTTESPYHDTYAVGDNPIAFPTQNRVIDSSGNVYNAMDLTFAGRIEDGYSDIGFWHGLAIALQGNSIRAYNKALVETGRYTFPLGVAAGKIIVYGDKVFMFSIGTSGSDFADNIDIALLSPADPEAALNPTGMPYTPDSIALDKNQNTVYLLSKASLSIFRWSISQSAYLESVSLAYAPLSMSYAAEQGRIYLSYSDGTISYIDLADSKEYPFAKTGYPSDVIAAGQHLIATGFFGALIIYNTDGINTDLNYWSESMSDITWDSNHQEITYIGHNWSRVYHIGLNTTSGLLGTLTDTPSDNSSLPWGPLRLSETGKFIALGSGQIINQKTMTEQIDIEPDYLKDLAWLHGNLFTLKGVEADTQLQRWNADFSLDAKATYKVAGSPIGLLPIASSGKLLLIYSRAEKPQFELLSYSEMDFDKDGVLDSQDALPTLNTESLDLDEDGIGNNADTDDDGDNSPDTEDAFPLDAKEALDTDNDGIGNNSDSDDDNDGVLDTDDAVPLDNKESSDIDNDGIGDNSDSDIDGDSVANSKDVFPLDSTEWQDTDKDGTGDNADTDNDNDGVADDADFYPYNAAKSALNAADFLPLTPGSSWLYDSSNQPATLGNAITIAGQSITPIQLPNGGKLYLKVVNNQIQLFGFYLPQAETDYGDYKTDFTFNQGINLLQNNDAINGKGNVNISPTYGNRALNWSASVEYMGREDYFPPKKLQRYSSLHSRLYFSSSTVIDGETISLSYYMEIWFAENIGIVTIDDDETTSILVSANIAQPTTDANPSPAKSEKSGGGKSDWSFLALLLLLGLGYSRQQYQKVAP